MDVVFFRELPAMGILRGVTDISIEPLVETVVAAGLRALEITMNTPNAAQLIATLNKVASGRLMVGAGTVLSLDQAKAAREAGATFIVSPTFIPEVVESCVKEGIPVFPGAFTPQEIYTAWSAGATMVKVFPAKFFGPAYLKEIKGPFADIELLACGGISPETVGSFLSAGASAVAFGASVFKKELLEKGDFASIQKAIEAILVEMEVSQ